MAIRMQQRRGTSEQWEAANPILAPGEIGWESETNKFKIGDGVNRWDDLDYFISEADLAGSIDDYIPLTQKGVANGVATLDESGKVPSTQLDIDELSQDAVNAALTAGTGISKTYNDSTNTITIAADTTVVAPLASPTFTGNVTLPSTTSIGDVSSTELGYLNNVTSAIQTQLDGKAATSHSHAISDVTNLQTTLDGKAASSHTHAIADVTDLQTSLDAKLSLSGGTMTGKITLDSDPTQALHATTKQYVDSLSEGLHIHASVVALSSSNISLPTAPATIDGVTLNLNDRVLLTGQTNLAENGIYVVINGDLARAADYNTAAEIDAGDFVFVSGGTQYNNTSWVQENAVTTLGTDPIKWSQFAGIGTITAGVGIEVTGSQVAVDFDDVAAKVHTHLLADITDVTASAAELNILDGVTASTTELNYVDGVTSAIQTQLDGKQPTLPAQTGNSGKFLSTDGTAVSWQTVPATTMSDTAPASPGVGDRWVKTTTWQEYIYFDGYWVEI